MFPEPPQRERHGGMTVNERLFAANLLETFNAAARSGKRAEMIDLLGRVELADQAAWIADQILAHPDRYGYIKP
jgi:hypothetical protein